MAWPTINDSIGAHNSTGNYITAVVCAALAIGDDWNRHFAENWAQIRTTCVLFNNNKLNANSILISLYECSTVRSCTPSSNGNLAVDVSRFTGTRKANWTNVFCSIPFLNVIRVINQPVKALFELRV